MGWSEKSGQPKRIHRETGFISTALPLFVNFKSQGSCWEIKNRSTVMSSAKPLGLGLDFYQSTCFGKLLKALLSFFIRYKHFDR
jgi:hypothetical protein